MEIISELDTKIYDDINNIYNFKNGFLFDKKEEVITSKITNIIDNNKHTTKLQQISAEASGLMACRCQGLSLVCWYM